MSETGDTPPRPPRNTRSDERAARNNARAAQDVPGREGERERRPAADRPARVEGARPSREDDRAGRPDRPARGENPRPTRDADRTGRPDRPFRAEGARPSREGDRVGRPDRPFRADGARPSRDVDRTGRPDRPERSDRSGRPDRPARPPAGDRGGRPSSGQRLWTQAGSPARNNAAARDSYNELEEERDPFHTRMFRNRHDDPDLPDDVTADELDRVARNELKTLSKDNAEGVARHLAMAARLIESDPTLAHQHAISAARRAGRIGIVRETLAITAYTTGDYALALRELRTHRRITGLNTQLPLMVDTERALGRPDKALELGRSTARHTLPIETQVELAIAMSGARLDLEQPQLALTELTIPQLDPTKAHSWSPALFAAFAAVQEELGNTPLAETWYTHADNAQRALDGVDDADEMITIVEEDFVGDRIIGQGIVGDRIVDGDHVGATIVDGDHVGERIIDEDFVGNDSDEAEQDEGRNDGDIPVVEETEQHDR